MTPCARTSISTAACGECGSRWGLCSATRRLRAHAVLLGCVPNGGDYDHRSIQKQADDDAIADALRRVRRASRRSRRAGAQVVLAYFFACVLLELLHEVDCRVSERSGLLSVGGGDETAS